MSAEALEFNLSREHVSSILVLRIALPRRATQGCRYSDYPTVIVRSPGPIGWLISCCTPERRRAKSTVTNNAHNIYGRLICSFLLAYGQADAVQGRCKTRSRGGLESAAGTGFGQPGRVLNLLKTMPLLPLRFRQARLAVLFK